MKFLLSFSFFIFIIIFIFLRRKRWGLSCAVPAQDGRYGEVRLYIFFYQECKVRDLKFLLEGHTYSVCDRRFGTIQNVFQKHEIFDIPRKWATVLEHEGLSNVTVNWVRLDMIKDYKSFLRLRYVSQNEDLEKERFEVKNIAWLNFRLR